MGTDIHGTFQKRNHTEDEELWVDASHNYEFDRHYQLFALLAGVRNGTGFAGCITGSPVKPLAEPRGLPPDIVLAGEYNDDVCVLYALTNPIDVCRWQDEYVTVCGSIWLGHHGFSWLTGEEMLQWYDNAVANKETFRQSGVVSVDEYAAWKQSGATRPRNYCGGISGAGLRTIGEHAHLKRQGPLGKQVARDLGGYTHIRCWWDQPVKEEVSYFFEEVRRLVEEHGEIRFVFGFDS